MRRRMRRRVRRPFVGAFTDEPTMSTTCDDGACEKRRDLFDAVRKATHRDASTTRTNADDANADQGAGTGPKAPLDVDELGRASWALMHTIAAYYPQKPTHAQRVQARRFFDALGDLYPCATCRADLRADVDAHPPRCESREALAKWVCCLLYTSPSPRD